MAWRAGGTKELTTMRIQSSRWKRLACRLRGSVAARLAREERGAVLVEFGFVVIPLAALMMAILQTSLLFFAQQTLETAAEKAVRQLVTGQAQTANMNAADFKQLVCSKLPAFMKCVNVMVDVQTAATFADASTTAPTITFNSSGQVSNSFKFEPGESGSINIVRVMYLWNTGKGPLGFDLSTMSKGRRLLYSTSVFKAEPYAS
jgi:Flp pilus assembly protein TadG